MKRCEFCTLYAICRDLNNCKLSEYAQDRIDKNIAKIEAMDKKEKLSKIPLNDEFFKANNFVNHGGEWRKVFKENGNVYSISCLGDIVDVYFNGLGGKFRMTNLYELETISNLLNIKIPKEVR